MYFRTRVIFGRENVRQIYFCTSKENIRNYLKTVTGCSKLLCCSYMDVNKTENIYKGQTTMLFPLIQIIHRVRERIRSSTMEKGLEEQVPVLFLSSSREHIQAHHIPDSGSFHLMDLQSAFCCKLNVSMTAFIWIKKKSVLLGKGHGFRTKETPMGSTSWFQIQYLTKVKILSQALTPSFER